MTKLGLAILILIFGATIVMASFITYLLLWNSSPTHVILPELILQ